LHYRDCILATVAAAAAAVHVLALQFPNSDIARRVRVAACRKDSVCRTRARRSTRSPAVGARGRLDGAGGGNVGTGELSCRTTVTRQQTQDLLTDLRIAFEQL
jgi:hypothetical protein